MCVSTAAEGDGSRGNAFPPAPWCVSPSRGTGKGFVLRFPVPWHAAADRLAPERRLPVPAFTGGYTQKQLYFSGENSVVPELEYSPQTGTGA